MTPRKVARSANRLTAAARGWWTGQRWAWDTVHALVPPPARMFASFGQNSVVVPPARVENPECIHIGNDVVILEHVWLAVEKRSGKPAPVLRFGDGTSINRFVKIECLGSVTFGRGAIVADQVYIGDIDLLPARGDGNERAEAEPQPVVIGDRVFIGWGSVIKPGVTLGDDAYVSAGSIVSTDVPARTLVGGSPARPLKYWEPQD